MNSAQTADSMPPQAHGARLTRARRRQVHIWLSEREYDWVRRVAQDRDQSLSELIRSVLVNLRSSSRATPLAGSTADIPSVTQILGTASGPHRYEQR
jgi:hypothetical protein